MSSPKRAAKSAPPNQARRRPERLSPDALERRLALLLPGYPRLKLLIAFSGGLDSSVLLHLLVALRKRHPRTLGLRAVHVDHGLSQRASGWARHCRRECRKLRVPLSVRRVDVRARRERGQSLEAIARELRLQVFQRLLRRGEVLVTAQHADDQLETVFLQLLRGAGVAGLAGMPEHAPFGRGQQLRPLLRWTRVELERIACEQGVRHVDDESNLDLSLDRNFLRLQVLPRVRERWPAAAATVSRSGRLCAEAAELVEDLGRLDLARLGLDAGERARTEGLPLAALLSLSTARQRNLLRAWLAACGSAPPDAVHLERIRTELPAARPDAHPRVEWARGRAVVRRVRGRLLFQARPLETR